MVRRQTNPLPALSRRNFLQLSGGCAALSSTSLLSTLVNLKLTNTAMAAGGDLSGYKAIVCVFLLGGYDSFNVLTPYEDQEYAAYAAARTNLALPKNELLQISDSSGRRFGVHPGMSEIHALYNQRKAAFIANVGSLVEPIADKASLAAAKKPLGLYSHSDLIQHWQTSIPQTRSQVTGWGGRMADMLTDSVNNHPTIAMNIALGSLNIMETGQNVVPYVVQSSGATTLNGYGNTGLGQDGMFSRFTDDVLGQNYGDLLEKSYARIRKNSIQAAIDFNNATGAVNLTTPFPTTSLGASLNMVAKAIGARNTLGQSRQIFFVSAGGWDHHDEVISNQANMLPVVSQALNSFYNATVELGVANDVVAFTASDFARTLSSNGNGSDHAWGGNHLVVGGGVAGRQVYGRYPETLALGNSLDTSTRGRLIPTTSVDEYNAELALWFGVANDSALVDVLPNIRSFYSESNNSLPIGFMFKGAEPPPTGLAGGSSLPNEPSAPGIPPAGSAPGPGF